MQENKLKMYHIHKIQSMIVHAAVPKLTHPNSLYHLKGSRNTIILKAKCSCLVPVVMKSWLKSILGGKGLFHFTHLCTSLKNAKEETQGKSLKQEPWRVTFSKVHTHLPCWYSRGLFATDTIAHSRLPFLPWLAIKKML